MSKVDKLLVEKFMRIAKIDHLKESFDKRMVKEGDGFDFPRHQSSQSRSQKDVDLDKELARATIEYAIIQTNDWYDLVNYGGFSKQEAQKYRPVEIQPGAGDSGAGGMNNSQREDYKKRHGIDAFERVAEKNITEVCKKLMLSMRGESGESLNSDDQFRLGKLCNSYKSTIKNNWQNVLKVYKQKGDSGFAQWVKQTITQILATNPGYNAPKKEDNNVNLQHSANESKNMLESKKKVKKIRDL